MYILSRKDIKFNSKNPTLIYVYGGFNNPLLPSYSLYHLLFLKHFHGVVAIVNTRGGK